jgi:H+/Cl- antiporter ClcA
VAALLPAASAQALAVIGMVAYFSGVVQPPIMP